jgi:hypothetical protein
MPEPVPALGKVAAESCASRDLTMPAGNAAVTRLEAEARYHRDRLALYRARVLGAKVTSPVRLRELERTSRAADDRLRAARSG